MESSELLVTVGIQDRAINLPNLPGCKRHASSGWRGLSSPLLHLPVAHTRCRAEARAHCQGALIPFAAVSRGHSHTDCTCHHPVAKSKGQKSCPRPACWLPGLPPPCLGMQAHPHPSKPAVAPCRAPHGTGVAMTSWLQVWLVLESAL